MKNWKWIALLGSALLITAGCGNTLKSEDPTKKSSTVSLASNPTIPQGSTLTDAQSQGLGPVFGTYQGTLTISDFEGNEIPNPYTLQIAAKQVNFNGSLRTVAVAILDASLWTLNEAAGRYDQKPLHVETYLLQPSTFPNYRQNYGANYAFTSDLVIVPEFSRSKIQFSFNFSFAASTSGAQLVPSQSMIHIMDCGLSQTLCSIPLSSVVFEQDLRKR